MHFMVLRPAGNLFGSKSPQLLAKKFWGFLEQGWLALGTNITASKAGKRGALACTTIEQNLLAVRAVSKEPRLSLASTT
jgi:hypothetical protein